MTNKNWWQEPKFYDDKTEDKLKKQLVSSIERAVSDNQHGRAELHKGQSAEVIRHVADNIHARAKMEHDAQKTKERREQIEQRIAGEKRQKDREAYEARILARDKPPLTKEQIENGPMRYFKKEPQQPTQEQPRRFDWAKRAESAPERPRDQPTPKKDRDIER